MLKSFDVLVVGELNADLILSGDIEPVFGQVEKIIDQASLVLGSSTAIFACGAARLGLRTAFLGKVGDDTFGHFMIQQLSQRGVDTAGIRIDPSIQTGISVILARGSDRAILTYPGSISSLCYEDLNLEKLPIARHLHLGSYFLLTNLRPNIPQLFKEARAQGLTISLDTNYDPAEKWNSGIEQVLNQIDIFLPNATELKAISHSEDITAALTKLSSQIPIIAVKMGDQGACAANRSDIYHSDTLAVKVVDTVGAGDSFDAGFIFGYLAGWDLPRTLRLACICGALSTQKAGGIAGQPTLDEAMSHF